MKQRYVILENPAPARTTRGGFEPMGQAETTGAKVKISVAELEIAEVHDLRRDPQVHSIGPAGVPLALIEPKQVDVAAAAPLAAWGLEATGVLTSPRNGRGVRVAVLDTGLHLQHEAFTALRTAGAIVTRNFTNGGQADVTDNHGHGTHCAGTIAGGTVGGVRIGVAPGIDRLIVGKVLGDGGGSNETTIQAIQWAVEQGAHVVSMSLGIDFPGLVERLKFENGMPGPAATSLALKQYRETVTLFGKLADFLSVQNVLLVAASGNESNRPGYTIDVAPPAASERVLKIGAVGPRSGGNYPIASFSNTGPDLVGPGVNIISAQVGGGLKPLSGTSMATPHVAGLAALWAERLLAKNGGVFTYDDLKADVLASAQALDGQRADIGRGLARAPQD